MTDPRVEQWINPAIHALQAYSVPEARGYIKLDAMENPYPWPPELIAAWLRQLSEVPVNRYPDPEANGIKARLRALWELPEKVALLLGNGSDELIQLLALAVRGRDRVLLAPEPSFVMYRLIANVIGLHYLGVPLRPTDFSLDPDAMLTAIHEYQPALVMLSYPNNPTGNLFDRDVLYRIIAASPGLVVMDEAYFPFASDGFIGALADHPNLLVMRTLSKLGLAGLRIGILAGSAAWLAELNKVRLPYNINSLSQRSTEFILDHADVLYAQVEQILQERGRLYQGLRELRGVQVWPSQTNFLLFRVQGRAEAIYEGLKAGNILIKKLHGSHPLLEDCLRVTIGTMDENTALLTAMKTMLA
jgi:histidinol-phosphate aminotransferase